PMFKELGQFAGLLTQLPKIRQEMENLQQRLGQITVEGDAGGGMVKVRVNGKMEIVACTLSDEALRLNDREMLEDLIRAAGNQALERIRQVIAEETARATAAFGGMPPGMGLPQMPG